MVSESPEEELNEARPPKGIDREVLFEAVLSNFEHLGLVPSEARILLALLRHVSATAPQLAVSAGVPRTSAYPVLESLRAKRLAARLPGDGPAIWTPAADHEALVDRLLSGWIERLHAQQQRAAQLKDALRLYFPQGQELDAASVQILSGALHAKQTYDRLLTEASEEVVISGWAPYSDTNDGFNPAVGQLLDRKIRTRLLYQQDELEEEGPPSVSPGISAYLEAGLEIKVIDRALVKSLVVDRRVALVGLSAGSGLTGGSLTALLIESADYAAAQAKSFEDYWDKGQPLTLEPADKS